MRVDDDVLRQLVLVEDDIMIDVVYDLIELRKYVREYFQAEEDFRIVDWYEDTGHGAAERWNESSRRKNNAKCALRKAVESCG